MWKCEHCGSVFERFDRVFDPEVGQLNCCPSCGWDGVVEAVECKVCGEYTSDPTNGACTDCYQKMKHKIEEIIKDMTEEEFELFVECVDEL